MALARPASTVITRKPASPPARTVPSAPADRSVEGGQSIVVPAGHIRRCIYRRVTAQPVRRRELQMYSVDCLHPSYELAVPLGQLDAARSACATCTLPGTFRPDED